MKLTVAIILIFLGAAIFIAPTAFSFLLQALGHLPNFTYTEVDDCHVVGSIMLVTGSLFGILTTIFSRRRSGGDSSK